MFLDQKTEKALKETSDRIIQRYTTQLNIESIVAESFSAGRDSLWKELADKQEAISKLREEHGK